MAAANSGVATCSLAAAAASGVCLLALVPCHALYSHANMLSCAADPLEVFYLSGVNRHLAAAGAIEPDAKH